MNDWQEPCEHGPENYLPRDFHPDRARKRHYLFSKDGPGNSSFKGTKSSVFNKFYPTCMVAFSSHAMWKTCI